MPTSTPAQQLTGRLAIAAGIVSIVNAVTIVLLYTVAPIFGPLNDIGIATAAVLQAALAWRVQWLLPAQTPIPSLIAATLGAVVALLGSGLVLSGATGWFAAGVVTTLGYAFLGIWLVAANHRARQATAWPARLAGFGIGTGAIMCLGFLAVPTLPSPVDSPGAAPWYVWVAYANGVGWFILLPVWNLRLGRYLLSQG